MNHLSNDNTRGTDSRRKAWRLLLEQETSGAFLKDLFATRLGDFSAEDRDFIRNMCMGTLRNKRLLDYNLDLHATRGIKDKALRVLLRLATYQLLFLSGVPAFAVVNTTVEIAKGEFHESMAGFSNALLKAISRTGLKQYPGTDWKALAINTSHPDWLVKRWLQTMKPLQLEAALRRNNEEAPLWIRSNPRRLSVEGLCDALQSEGVELEPCSEVPLYLRILKGADRALRHEAFASGAFSFQDPIAFWVVYGLHWRPGLSFLDTCSAPGGKSALLVEMALHRGEDLGQSRLVCCDLSFMRLRKIFDARERLGHQELMPVCADLKDLPFQVANGENGFDCVLVDAPCSNLGVLRRRPEARWNLTPEKIPALATRQFELLVQASKSVAQGGRLVYATCSAEREETWNVVSRFLESEKGKNFKLAEIDPHIPTALIKKGCLWVYPGETEYDGFFAATLAKTF